MSNRNRKQTLSGDLFVQRVVDDAGNRLGWAVATLIGDGARAEYLVLNHFQSRPEAWSAQQGIGVYVEANRRMLSNLASSSEIWEWISSVQDDTDKYWTVLND